MYIHNLNVNDLKAVFKFLIFTLLLSASFASIHAQSFELKVYAKDSSSAYILKTIAYVKTHTTKKSVLNEIDSISNKLTLIGFINNNYIINEKDLVVSCVYTLNKKIETIRIHYNNPHLKNDFLNRIAANYTSTYFEVPLNNIERTLNLIIEHFEDLGYSFTTISLKNLVQQNEILTAQLNLEISEKRTINKVIVKGYSKFPKKYLNPYLDLKQHTVFNKNTLNSLHELINTIPFVSQIKKPAVLFTKDSTTLFLYLKKKSTSKFDGIIGFSNEENSTKLKFNGYLDLYLNNIFNKGESFGLNWKNNGGDTQTLDLEFNSPYILNSKFSAAGEFSIFKQDSTYITTKSQLKINYDIDRNNVINATLSDEHSDLSSFPNTTSEVKTFKKNFIGISYTYKLPSKLQHFTTPKFLINIVYLKGNRIIENSKSDQTKLQLFAQYNYTINEKNSIYIKTTNELLDDSNLLQNELFRIGGTNSIRGFNEQSVFTSKYTVTNLEYHYNINPTTYIYTITDFALLADSLTNSTTTLYGVGFGYSFSTNYSIVNMSYVIGKNNQTPFNINNSKVHIKISYPF